ncbi:MAG: hypothetical protein K2R93_11520 [Gemmatimonadaceae bacterium]|nr:hypothetical protein [Gemmatimonadaceae bacterium]
MNTLSFTYDRAFFSCDVWFLYVVVLLFFVRETRADCVMFADWNVTVASPFSWRIPDPPQRQLSEGG